MERLLKVADLRDLESQVLKGMISYSRMVEIINEKHFLALVNLRMELSPTKDKNHNLKAEKQHYDAPVSGKDALKDMPVTTMEEYFKLTPVSEVPETDGSYTTFSEKLNPQFITGHFSDGQWSISELTHWLKPIPNPKTKIEKNIKSAVEWLTEPDGGFACGESNVKEAVEELTSLLKTIS